MEDVSDRIYQMEKELQKIRGDNWVTNETLRGKDGNGGLMSDMREMKLNQEKLLVNQDAMYKMIENTTDTIKAYIAMNQKQTDRQNVGVIIAIVFSVLAIVIAVLSILT